MIFDSLSLVRITPEWLGQRSRASGEIDPEMDPEMGPDHFQWLRQFMFQESVVSNFSIIITPDVSTVWQTRCWMACVKKSNRNQCKSVQRQSKNTLENQHKIARQNVSQRHCHDSPDFWYKYSSFLIPNSSFLISNSSLAHLRKQSIQQSLVVLRSCENESSLVIISHH